MADRTVGSVEPDDARLLAREIPGLALDDRGLRVDDGERDETGTASRGRVTGILERAARLLRAQGRLGAWRNEALPVLADDDVLLGCIERTAARALGLRTVAVHLLGWRADGAMWVQRRAHDKPVDPGMLDTLAGGMVGVREVLGEPRMEDLAEAMGREADEEAGVPPGTPMTRIAFPPLRIARPVAEGYMVEDLVGFEATLDARYAPFNRDGEVAGFESLATDALVERIGRGEFTLEASLLILERLRRAGRDGS